MFEKKSSGANTSGCVIQLAEKKQKSIIRKFGKLKVYSSLKDNISGACIKDKQSISKYEKRFRFFLCDNNICSKHAWVPLKDKRGITITNAFRKNLRWI